MRTTHLPSCFGIPRPSCAPWLFIDALSHLFLHSRHTSSICLTDVKELPTSLHHCRFICLFHLPLPPTSKSFQRRFIAVASSLSLLHCHDATTPGRYLGSATRHQKHHIIFLEPNRERFRTWACLPIHLKARKRTKGEVDGGLQGDKRCE